MQVSPREKQYGRRGKRAEVTVTAVEPTEVTLSEDERQRRLFNRNW